MSGGNLKNLMQSNSPLSDTVIISVTTKNNGLSPGNYKEVMTLNLPVSRKAEPYFFEKLTTLPNGISKQLQQMQGSNPNATTLTTLQRQIESSRTWRGYILNSLLYNLLGNDSLNIAIQILEAENNVESKMTLT